MNDNFRYDYKENKYFIEYAKERDLIKEKYKDIIVGNTWKPGPLPKNYKRYTDAERNRYRKYLNEMGNLLFKKNGSFQKFLWDDLSEADKLAQERKTRGRINAKNY